MNFRGVEYSVARALLLLCILVFIVNLGLRFAGYRTSLKNLRAMATSQGADDSWYVMFPALDAARSGEKGMYSKVFFSDRVKYIDPPTALLLPWILQKLQPSAPNTRIVTELNVVGWAATWAYIAMCIAILITQIGKRNSSEVPASLGDRSAKLLIVLGALALSVQFYPASIAVRLGQTQPSVVFLFTVAVWFWLRGSRSLAGAALGIAALIKAPLLLFLVWGVLRRERGFLIAFSCVYAAFLGVSILIFGVQAHVEYVQVGQYVSQRGESLYANQSINGLLNRMFQGPDWRGWSYNFKAYPPYNPVVHIGTLINAICVIAIALFLPKKEKRGTIFDFAGMAFATILAAPLAWEHHYATLLPIYALLFLRFPKTRFLLAISFVFVGTLIEPLININSPPWSIVQSYVLFGAIIPAVILYRFLFQERTDPVTDGIVPPAAEGVYSCR